jgi:16S rRNA processing protein RimM
VALVRLGTVVRAIGLRGHLGIGGTEGVLGDLERIALQRPGGGCEVEWRDVLEARPQGRVWAVRVEGIADRSESERWVGAAVLADRESLPEAGEDRHYWSDLVGLPVVTVSGEDIGEVTGLYETGAVDVLVVTRDGQEKLIPLAPYVQVDVAARRIVVDPPDGLLDG